MRSISPPTPVARSSADRFCSEPRLCGTSLVMSVSTRACVSRPHPSAARASPSRSTARGRWTASTSAALRSWRAGAPSSSSSRAPRHDGARRRSASARTRAPSPAIMRRVPPAAEGAGARPTGSASAAAPAVSAHASAMATPATSSTPKPCTIGTGESSSTSIAAALAAAAAAMVGAPSDAARPIASTRAPPASARGCCSCTRA